LDEYALPLSQPGLFSLLVLINKVFAQPLESAVSNGASEDCLTVGFQMAYHEAGHILGDAVKEGVVGRGNRTVIKRFCVCRICLVVSSLKQSAHNG